MSTYELDDDLVRRLIENPDQLPRSLAMMLEKQLPLPVPTKIGAVVRTDMGVFLRADGSDSGWIRARQNPPFLEVPDWHFSGDIGRITEVLSEGVDL